MCSFGYLGSDLGGSLRCEIALHNLQFNTVRAVMLTLGKRLLPAELYQLPAALEVAPLAPELVELRSLGQAGVAAAERGRALHGSQSRFMAVNFYRQHWNNHTDVLVAQKVAREYLTNFFLADVSLSAVAAEKRVGQMFAKVSITAFFQCPLHFLDDLPDLGLGIRGVGAGTAQCQEQC